MANRELLHPGLTAVHIEGNGDLSRGEMLVRGALAMGAFYGLDAVSPYVRRALAASGGGDVHVLNFALEFEYVQLALYEGATQRLKATGALKRLIQTLAGEERQHVQALRTMIKTLGGKPPAEGQYEFDDFSAETFLVVAEELELSSIHGYNGAIPAIKSKEVRELAGSIVQVEGRHAATVRIQGKSEPAPEAFDGAETENQVLLYMQGFTAV